MICVAHDQVEAMTMGDRIVVLEDGHIQQVDTPLGLYRHPVNRFVAGFISSPSMNFIHGKITSADQSGLTASGGAFSIRLGSAGRTSDPMSAYTGREIVMGIRPEDVHVAGRPHMPSATAEVDLTVEVLEPMGSEIVVYARAEDAGRGGSRGAAADAGPTRAACLRCGRAPLLRPRV